MPKPSCLVICPVGSPGSDQRKQAEEVTRYLIERAVGDAFNVQRCDLLSRPGEITTELKDRIRRDTLVIADLTGSNPNVMYEVGLRHAADLPCVHIARKGSDLPFDLGGHRTVIYDLSGHASTEQAIEELKRNVQGAFSDDSRLSVHSPIELWQRLHSILDPQLPESDYSTALEKVLEIVKNATLGPRPVVRLWGNRGKRELAEAKRFPAIGRSLGHVCARIGAALSCTDLQFETLEHWVLDGVHEAVKEGAPPVPVYVHFNVREGYARESSSRELLTKVDGSCQLIEIPYPPTDSDRLDNLDDEVARERVAAHDARWGSLLQCDAVLLVGGNKSAQHLVQLLARVDRYRAANPIVFIPIPWISGIGKVAHSLFKGVLDDTQFVTAVTAPAALAG